MRRTCATRTALSWRAGRRTAGPSRPAWSSRRSPRCSAPRWGETSEAGPGLEAGARTQGASQAVPTTCETLPSQTCMRCALLAHPLPPCTRPPAGRRALCCTRRPAWPPRWLRRRPPTRCLLSWRAGRRASRRCCACCCSGRGCCQTTRTPPLRGCPRWGACAWWGTWRAPTPPCWRRCGGRAGSGLWQPRTPACAGGCGGGRRRLAGHALVLRTARAGGPLV